jgi:hypothetical protein
MQLDIISCLGQLIHATLFQLYKRISLDYDLEEGPRKELLQKLAATAGIAQQTLRPVAPTGLALAHVRTFSFFSCLG